MPGAPEKLQLVRGSAPNERSLDRSTEPGQEQNGRCCRVVAGCCRAVPTRAVALAGWWQPLNGKKEKGKLGLGRLDRKNGDWDGKGKIGGKEENQISSFVPTIPMTIIIISVATNVLIASQPRQLIVLPKRKGVLDRRRLVWFDPTPGNHDLNIDIVFVYVEFKIKFFCAL